jgi:hypothetical protein
VNWRTSNPSLTGWPAENFRSADPMVVTFH